MTQLHVSISRVCAISCLVCLVSGPIVGCKNQPQTTSDDTAETVQETRTSSTDRAQQTERNRRKQTAWGGEIEFSLSEPPEEMSRTIDGSFDDWKDETFRSFSGAEHVVKGDRFWNDASDVSLEVAAHSDRGRLYFAVEVTDDVVLDASSDAPFSDGVVLWLRDPGLAELRTDLPESYMKGTELQPELAILFTPDGQFWRRDDENGGLYRKGIEAQTTKTDEGYRVEMALTVGVLQQVSELPMEEVAFRVEAIDGDEPKRRGKQSHFSTLPSENGSPKFALLGLDSWIPYEPLVGQPPREDVLGRWRLGDRGWTFDAFEVVPEDWRLLSEPSSLDQTLRDHDVYSEVCSKAREKAKLVEAYQSRRGDRVALVLCGTRPTDGTCPDDARSHLFWMRLSSPGDGVMSLERTRRVTRKPMSQCPTRSAEDRPLHTAFSLYPLTMFETPVWAIGWHKMRESDRERLHRSGVWFVNPSRSKARIGTLETAKTRAKPRERTIEKTHLYLTPVDRKEGRDICAIETVRKQTCDDLDTGCRTRDRGVGRYAHIRMWSRSKGTFERYLMSKHRRCRARFDFTSRDAYLLFHRNKRLGLIHSNPK